MIPANFFDGQSSRRQSAVLRLSQGRLYLAGDWGMREATLCDVAISEPMGGAPRTVRFADGAFAEISDIDAFAELLAKAGHDEPWPVRMHKRWSVVLASMLSIIAIAIASYIWVLPAIAGFIAPRLPSSLGEQLSKATLESLDRHILAPSTLPPQREQQLRAHMATFSKQSHMPSYALHFRAAANGMPPNAFALPNGDIVILDSLLVILDDDEALAVFAHELGHVEYHHGLRMLIQSAVVSTAAAVYLGDISSLVAALATASLQANYSQAFETEADYYAARVLKQGQRSPLALASALEKIEKAVRKATPSGEKSSSATDREFAHWFSSHPTVTQRIAQLKRWAATAAD